MVESLTFLALQDFQAPQQIFSYSKPSTQIRLVSSKAEGSQGFHIKEMMWSLRITACHFRMQERYAEVSYKTLYRDGPMIGFGQISFPPPSTGAGTSSPLNSSSNSDRVTTTDFRSLPGGINYPPELTYMMMMNVLIAEAEHDPDSEIPTVYTYDQANDVSLAMGATSTASMDKFTSRVAILALRDIAEKMAQIPQPFRWKQFTFLIRRNGAIVGRGALAKGTIEALGDSGFFMAGNDTAVDARVVGGKMVDVE